MALTSSSFKLSKTSKVTLATYVDPHIRSEVMPHMRGELKRLLIAAEVAASIKPKTRDPKDRIGAPAPSAVTPS